jgi:hypothetical protein
MIRLLLLALPLAAEPKRVVLIEETVRLEAMQQRVVAEFPLAQQGAMLELNYQAVKGAGEGLRVIVLADGAALTESSYAPALSLRVPLKQAARYEVRIENKRQRLGFALVDVQAALLFSAPREAARTLDPKRRYFTIAVSAAVFAMIVAYTSVRLGAALYQRWKA